MALPSHRLDRAAAADFCLVPVGRYVVASTACLVWCAHPTVCGAVYTGTPGEEDVQALLPLLGALDTASDMAARFDVLTDGGQVVDVGDAAFRALAAYVRERLPVLRRRVRRHAIVRPDGLGRAGAAVEGLYPMLGAGAPNARTFASLAPALEWLGRRAHVPSSDELETLRGALSPEPRPLDRLRTLLADAPRTKGLADAARTLGLSERTLRRALESNGSTFRDEVAQARVRRACELLVTTSDKVETIAQRVGFASRAWMSVQFRRLTGETPADYRARRRNEP